MKMTWMIRANGHRPNSIDGVERLQSPGDSDLTDDDYDDEHSLAAEDDARLAEG